METDDVFRVLNLVFTEILLSDRYSFNDLFCVCVEICTDLSKRRSFFVIERVASTNLNFMNFLGNHFYNGMKLRSIRRNVGNQPIIRNVEIV